MSSAQFLTPTDVATILGIRRKTVYDLISRKHLRAVRVGRVLRVPKTYLDAYIARWATAPSDSAAVAGE